jgi:hypothetical protein
MSEPTTVSARMAQRYDTAANWTAANPTLLAGEIGVESDTSKIKIGTGSTAWNSLAYQPWATTPIPVNAGGTGQTTYSNGQLLIGKTDGTLAKATLTAGTGITITNGDGSVSIASSGGTVTSVTGTSPIASTGGTTPAISIQDGTTTQKGAVQLEDSTTSTSTTKAATPNSVKLVLDAATIALGVADAALPKAGGTLTGNVILDNQVDARFREATANGTNYVGFQAPATIAADVLWTLPATDGSNGQVLKTDGSGTLDWVSPSVSGPILENQQIIGASYTLSTGYNGVSAGPVTVAATYTVTVPAGAVWVII